MLASRSGKLERLTAYCDKTAAASASDYRWPLLRARLAMLEEDHAAAAVQYARCLKIVPQRADLVAESARPMEILGDWAGLQKLYADLSRQQYDAPEWLRQAATAAWRGGRDAEARELLRRCAEAQGGSPTDQALAQYDASVEIHHEDWATETALKLLHPDAPAASLLNDLRYRGVLATARRAGRMPDVLGRLLALFDAAIANEDADRIGALSSLLGNNLEEVFGEPLPAEEREAAVRAILARLPGLAGRRPGRGGPGRLPAGGQKGLRQRTAGSRSTASRWPTGPAPTCPGTSRSTWPTGPCGPSWRICTAGWPPIPTPSRAPGGRCRRTWPGWP